MTLRRCARELVALAALITVSTPTLAQTWAKTYGRAGDERTYSVEPTIDGGFVLAGSSTSGGNADLLVMKLNLWGEIEWTRTYGAQGTERARSIVQTSDGGYVVAGSTSSYGAGGRDLWVLKLAATGQVEWQWAYGGPGNDDARSVRQTFPDNGYIVAGTYNVTGSQDDIWLLKLLPDGARGQDRC